MNEIKAVIIDDLLKEIISHSSKCAHCEFLHKDENNCYCFWAAACLTSDFYYWKEED